MDLPTFTKESALNRLAYGLLRDQIRGKYAGKYVALAQGKLVGAADTFDSARALVNALDPVPEFYLVFPANQEPNFDLAYDLAGSL